MRKIVLMMAVTACFSVICNHVEANIYSVETGISTSGKFYQVDIKSLNPNIQEAIYKAYPNCLIKETYMSDSNFIIKYKFVITTQEGQETRVFMNEKGEVVSY